MTEGKASIFEKLTPVLFVAIVLMAFALGVLWQKVENLQSGGGAKVAGNTDTAAAPTVNPLSIDNLKQYAKDLKLKTDDFNSCLDSGKFAQAVQNDLTQGEQNGVQGTPAFFINGKFLGGAFPYEYFKEIIDKELEGKGTTKATDYSAYLQQAYNDPNGKAFDPEPKNIDLGNAAPRGEKNAKVTVVEFSDFECPYCVRFYSDTYKKIKADYVDTGKVRFVYKQFPLASIHPNAQKAAEAALCANDQNKFWDYHDKMFESSATN